MTSNTSRLRKMLCCATAVLVILIITICGAMASRDGSDKKAVSDIHMYDDMINAYVTLSGDTAVVDGSGAAARGAEITIVDGGAYIFSGELNDGRIIVEAAKSQDVTIILNGVSISNRDKAVIFAKSGKSVTVHVASGTENTLTVGNEIGISSSGSDNKVDLKGSQKAVIMSKRDLNIEGDGVLNINGYANNGVQSKVNLNISDLTLNLTAANDGIKSGVDMTVRGGTYNLRTQGDAVASKGKLTIDDASFNIITGDGAESVEKKVNSQEVEEEALQGQQSDESEPDKVSSKGIKSDGRMTISSGSILIDCIDDGIHSSDDIVINGGTIEIKASDDGIRSDKDLVINDGTVNVNYSYEGLEAAAIIFNGGETSVKAGDDGLCASVSSTDCRIEVNGGKVVVDCEGDGLDSDRDVIINAGDVYVKGTSTGKDSPADIGTDEGGRFLVNGGTLLALGYSDYIDGTDEASEQLTLIFKCDHIHSAGDTVTVFDSTGQVVQTFDLEKTANSITFSSDKLKMGDIYTFVVGDENGQIVADQKCAWN